MIKHRNLENAGDRAVPLRVGTARRRMHARIQLRQDTLEALRCDQEILQERDNLLPRPLVRNRQVPETFLRAVYERGHTG